MNHFLTHISAGLGLWNHCPVPLKFWVCIPLRRGVLDYHYVIKFVSDLRQVSGFLQILRFPPPIKLTATINWNIVERNNINICGVNLHDRPVYVPGICHYHFTFPLSLKSMGQLEECQIISFPWWWFVTRFLTRVFSNTHVPLVEQAWFSPDTAVSSTNKTDRYDKLKYCWKWC
jgi:hypothetical protein